MSDRYAKRRLGIVKVNPEHLRGLGPDRPGHSALAHSPRGTIAPGFSPRPALNMKNFGGRLIHDLSFRSFYLGGSSWSDSDIQNINDALSGAMSDPRLNNVMQQYYPQGSAITSNFFGAEKLSVPVEAEFNRDSVNPVIEGLLGQTLRGTDFDNTVICLFLPPGAILTTDAAGGVGHALEGDEDKDSSAEGLGGYHGSCHIQGTRVYFAVGVYSQFIHGRPNGIPAFPDPWKDIVATFYHELNEARTDPDVEEANRTGRENNVLGWYAPVDGGGEIGDIPMNEAGRNLSSVMVEVPLASGKTAPIQLMWSNAVSGPQGPFG
jgi:hypothetical protein